MRKGILILGILSVLSGTFVTSTSCGNRSAKKGADTLKVNTTELGADVMGFKGPTPVEISTVKGVITRIEALPNQESPRFFQMVVESGLLEKLVGKTVEEAKATQLDAVSGATYSSEAVIQNIRLGLDTL